MTTYAILEANGEVTIGGNDDLNINFGDVIVVELHDENGGKIQKQGEVIDILD